LERGGGGGDDHMEINNRPVAGIILTCPPLSKERNHCGKIIHYKRKEGVTEKPFNSRGTNKNNRKTN
jgi:hypothetical protein